MGNNFIAFYKNKIKHTWKVAFLAAFCGCLLVHMYKFTNMLPNHDSIFNFYTDQDMTISGRWFLSWACGISSYFDLPWINGLLCSVYLAITSAVVIALFDINNPVVIVLTSLLLVTTPATTETLFFEFTADGYLLGLMLSALAAFFSCKGCGWKQYLLSGICLCLSCGIYQAYISFAIVLCICWLVNCILNDEFQIKSFGKWFAKHIIIYVSAMAAYYILWNGILLLTGTEATSYQGIDTVGQISISTLVSGMTKAVQNIVLFFIEWNILEHPITVYAVLNIIFLLCLFLIFLIAVFKSGIYKQRAKLLVVIFCLSASIPMISIWCFLSDSVVYRPMMLHSICIFYIFALILFDRWVAVKYSTIFGLFIGTVIFNFSIMANISYVYLEKCYDKSYYIGSQILEQIVEYDSADYSRIAFVGRRDSDVAISDTYPGNRIHILAQLIEKDLFYDHQHAVSFLDYAFDFRTPGVTELELAELAERSDVQDMGIWPAEDSVKVIDGVLIFKLQECE